MKKIIALITALVMTLALTGCIGAPSTKVSTADEVKPLSSYSKDFAGLKQYLYDFNGLKSYEDSKTDVNSAVTELYYDMLGAGDGIRYSLNGNAYVEIYDFSRTASATADSAAVTKAKDILADVKDDGKFYPIEGGTEMTGVLTKSGNYLLAWDASRSYDYEKNVATDTVIENW